MLTNLAMWKHLSFTTLSWVLFRLVLSGQNLFSFDADCLQVVCDCQIKSLVLVFNFKGSANFFRENYWLSIVDQSLYVVIFWSSWRLSTSMFIVVVMIGLQQIILSILYFFFYLVYFIILFHHFIGFYYLILLLLIVSLGIMKLGFETLYVFFLIIHFFLYVEGTRIRLHWSLNVAFNPFIPVYVQLFFSLNLVGKIVYVQLFRLIVNTILFHFLSVFEHVIQRNFLEVLNLHSLINNLLRNLTLKIIHSHYMLFQL